MNKKDKLKHYLWAFPLAGGFLGLIALLSPAVYISSFDEYWYAWMWGLITYQYSGFNPEIERGTGFTVDPAELSLSITCSLLVLICSIAIISSAFSYRKHMRINIMKKTSWLAPSILIIVGATIWIVVLELMAVIKGGYSFWNTVNPGFGLIGLFLGSFLSLIGYGVSKISPETREVIAPMKKESPMLKQAFDQLSEATGFSVCPNCGYKIVHAKNRFCTNCGFDFGI